MEMVDRETMVTNIWYFPPIWWFSPQSFNYHRMRQKAYNCSQNTLTFCKGKSQRTTRSPFAIHQKMSPSAAWAITNAAARQTNTPQSNCICCSQSLSTTMVALTGICSWPRYYCIAFQDEFDLALVGTWVFAQGIKNNPCCVRPRPHNCYPVWTCHIATEENIVSSADKCGPHSMVKQSWNTYGMVTSHFWDLKMHVAIHCLSLRVPHNKQVWDSADASKFGSLLIR